MGLEAELVKTDQNEYEEYEALLLQRDAYRKQARAAQILYIREFGELITQSFQKKIDCIAKKKCIAYYQAAANRGESVNLDEVDAYLRETMEVYNQQLEEMLKDYESCRKVGFVSPQTVVQVKVLYHKIAKLIHPDMHPGIEEKEELHDLWSRVEAAYRGNDLDALEELEILVHKAIRESGEDAPEIVIPNLGERITAVREEIEIITTTDPYLYRQLLDDPEASAKKKCELQEEIDAYQVYGEQLDQILQEFLKEGVIVTWSMN